MGPRLFSDIASVVWDDIVTIKVVPKGRSNVSPQERELDHSFFLCKVDGGDPLHTWFEVEQERWVGAHICQLGPTGHNSIIDFNFVVGQSCQILLNVDLVI